MDPARSRGASPNRGRGGDLRLAAALGASLIACSPILGDADRIIAIEVDGPANKSVEEGATLTLIARAISASGDTVPDVSVIWQLLDVDTGQVGFTLDSLSGIVTAVSPGSGRVRARVESLVSFAVVTITVDPAPDSVAAGGEQRLTVGSGVSTSPSMITAVYDVTTEPGTTLPLSNKPVQFDLVEPAPGSPEATGLFLTLNDTVPGAEPHRFTATTAASGQASATVRRITDVAVPDSVIIDATALTATGAIVPGSPIRFIVIFEQP